MALVPKVLVMALAVSLSGLFVASPATAAAVAVPYTLTAGDPVLTTALGDDGSPCAEGTTVGSFAYQVVRFTVSSTGSYAVSDTSTPHDGRVGIYTGEFSPASQSTNCLAFVDADETVTLDEGVTYDLVLSTGTDGGLGDFSVTFDGPGSPTVLTATTTTLATSPNPSQLSQTTTLTATVAGGAPTGSVTFRDGVDVLGVSPLSGGVATLAVSSLALGDHSLTASYGGDALHDVSVGAVVHTVVPVPLIPTTTTLVTSPNPSQVSQTTTLTATVAGGAPTGSVEFRDGVAVLGTSPLSGGVATLAVSSLALGDHSLTASYGGDALHDVSTGGVVHTVVAVPPPAPTQTATTLVANPNPSELSKAVTLAATVAGGSPTGSVTFRDGAQVLGVSALAGGKATLSVSSFKLGDHALTATYSGDATHTASAGAVSHRVVPGAKPKVKLTISDKTPYIGQKVKLEWVVTGADKVKALGSWKGKLGDKGSRTVKIKKLGFHLFKLKATNVNGSKKVKVKAVAVRAPKALKVLLDTEIVGTDSRVTVQATGLEVKERFKVFLDDELLAKGFAGAKGAVSAVVRIPKDVTEGDHVLSVMGSNDDRVGSTDVVVVRPKTLDVEVEKATLKPSKTQTVTVTGLVAGETLTLTYDGEVLAEAIADEDGAFEYTFAVGVDEGDKTVEVVGAIPLRKGEATFEVRGNPEGTF